MPAPKKTKPVKMASKPTARGLSDAESGKLTQLLETGEMRQAKVRARMAENEKKRTKKAPAPKVAKEQGIQGRNRKLNRIYKDMGY